MDKLAEKILKEKDCLINGTGTYEGIQLVRKERCLELMRSYHKAKMKEELIKFMQNIDLKRILYDSREKVVDDYLKLRNNGTIQKDIH